MNIKRAQMHFIKLLLEKTNLGQYHNLAQSEWPNEANLEKSN